MSTRRKPRAPAQVHIWLVLLAVTIGAAAPAVAHDVLVASSLRNHPVQAGIATAVTLRFNAKIEPSLSKVLLLTTGGKARALDIARGRQAGEIVVQLPPLPPGVYGLRYKILASDGHLTDETLRFTVREQP